MIELARQFLLEIVIVAASFGILWLSFCIRDRRRHAQPVRQPQSTHAPIPDLAKLEQDDRAAALPSAAD